jgi:hypothetical protein
MPWINRPSIRTYVGDVTALLQLLFACIVMWLAQRLQVASVQAHAIMVDALDVIGDFSCADNTIGETHAAQRVLDQLTARATTPAAATAGVVLFALCH